MPPYTVRDMAELDLEETGVEEIQAFRDRAAAFLSANCRPRREPGGAPDPGDIEAARAFQAALAAAGLAGLTYPKEFGGAGLTRAHQEAFDELSRQWYLPNAPFAISHGMCLPVLNQFGTDAQKERFLADNISGRSIWCQMFSEPGAGSDVAGLSTRAERDGDQWVLNGQKVWTSGAQYCDFGIIVARTDPGLAKHRGLSMFIVDMSDPCIEVRPLRQMSGESGFNEVFFTDLHIPADWLVGDLNQGWSLAVAMLMFERVSIGAGASSLGGERVARGLVDLAHRLGLSGDAVVRQGLADLWIAEQIKGYIGQRIRDAARAGRVPGPEGSIAKLNGALLARKVRRVSMDLVGASGQAWEHQEEAGARWAHHCLAAAGISIAGGTDEVQRNIIGERVLGLPKEPDPFKGAAWEDVPRN